MEKKIFEKMKKSKKVLIVERRNIVEEGKKIQKHKNFEEKKDLGENRIKQGN